MRVALGPITLELVEGWAEVTDDVPTLEEFVLERGLGPATDECLASQPLRLASATVPDGEHLVRVWYVSDGQAFAKITYVANAADPSLALELEECEQMVRSIAFDAAEGST